MEEIFYQSVCELQPARRLVRAVGGRFSLTRGYYGCAAGWGRIFTTGVTRMGSHFQQIY